MQKTIRTTALLTLLLTIIWIIFMGISMSQIKPSWSEYEYLKWVANPDIYYEINYINATILTSVVIMLFTILFNYLSDKNKYLGLIGFVFIPIYGMINLICYSLQITIVPSMAISIIKTPGDMSFVFQLVQSRSDTIIGFLNGLAYSILGIPSIIYGCLLIKDIKKLSGLLLLTNGLLCIIGVIGYMVKNTIMSTGVMLGGVTFLISLVFMVLEFRNNE